MNKTKILSILLCCLILFALPACGGNNIAPGSGNNGTMAGDSEAVALDAQTGDPQSGDMDIPSENSDDPQENTGTDPSAGSRILVACFSLAGEQYEVGVIEKGNTQIVAELIAQQTGANLFFIDSTEAYPTTYEGLLEISRKEEDDPPQIAGTVENMDDYDVVFVGYPIWWGNLPSIIKVFLESYDFSGKTVIPFCTHAGSGLAGTQGTIESLCAGATVQDGLAVRGSTAQNETEKAESAVKEWLDGLGLEYG